MKKIMYFNAFLDYGLSLQPGIALKTHSAAHMDQGSLSVAVCIISMGTSAWDRWDLRQIMPNRLVVTPLSHTFIIL